MAPPRGRSGSFLVLLESVPSAMAIASEHGEIELVNGAMERLFGYGRTELSGRPVHILFPEAARSHHERLFESFVRDPYPYPLGAGMDLPARRKDGSLFPAEISLTPVMDDGLRVAVTVSDVTERRRAEAAAVAGRIAEQANRAKDEFLSRMSHEFRTPLNAVLGFAQMLEMEGLDPKHRESVVQIRKGGEHLLTLIDEVLDISRISSGSLVVSLEPVCVSEALHGAVDLTEPLAVERGITLGLRDPKGLFVWADRQRLTQILLNLLSNAIKYNREAGTVDVSSAETPAGRLQIQVSDTGPGIPRQMLGRVFAPFDRLEAEVMGVEGTGLGLPLSKALAEAMGGTLDVRSEVGAGAVFSLELALVEPQLDP